MKSKTEIRNWLLENAVDVDGDLNIIGLDFSEFDGDVDIRVMKVKGNLFQSGHEVQGNLYQTNQKVKGNLFQSNQKVQGGLFQDGREVRVIEEHYERLIERLENEKIEMEKHYENIIDHLNDRIDYHNL